MVSPQQLLTPSPVLGAHPHQWETWEWSFCAEPVSSLLNEQIRRQSEALTSAYRQPVLSIPETCLVPLSSDQSCYYFFLTIILPRIVLTSSRMHE